MKLWSGTAAEARMDETIIFKLFMKREKTGSLDKVPDALILHDDETEWGLPCLLHQHVLHHRFLLHFSLEGTISGMRHTHTSDLITCQFRAASAWSWRIHCLPPSQSAWHPLGEHCSPEKLVFTLSFLFPPSYSCQLFFWLGLCIFSTTLLHRGSVTPVLSQAVVLQSLHWTVSRDTSKDALQAKKIIFFLKIPNTIKLAVHRTCRSIWLGKMGLSSCQA